MDVRITNRRGTVSPGLREYAETRARKLTRYEPRILAIELLFDEDHGQVSVEGRADVAGAPTVVARSEADSGRSALDHMLQRLGRQLRRKRSKRVDHQAPPAGNIIP
jgi:ribosomal subunit interface protein